MGDASSERVISTTARAAFRALNNRAYLYWGGLAPAADPVRAAMDRWLEVWQVDPIEHRSRYTVDLEACRGLLGRLLGADPDDLAIVDNTARAANLAVAVVDAHEGQNVVVDATTYDSCVYPWLLARRRGVELRIAEPAPGAELDAIGALVDNRTAAVSVSHVSHKTGFRHDLDALVAIAHNHGSLLLVDVAQSAGVTSIDVRRSGIDVAYGVSMKWLCGPPGLGYLYLSPELMEREPPHVGHAGTSFGPDGSLSFKAGGRRHDIGVANLPGLAGFRAALEFMLTVGVARIEARVQSLTRRVVEDLRSREIEVLTPASAAHRAGIVAAFVGDPVGLRQHLREHRVDVWTWDRDGRLRVDCHGFNTDDDLGLLFGALASFEREGGRLARP